MQMTEAAGGCPMGFDGRSFADPAVQRSPYEFYKWLRSNEPVYWDEGIQSFVVTTDELVRQAALDWETFSNVDSLDFGSRSDGAEEAAAIRARTYQTKPLTVLLDPPRHTSFRHLINSVLSPKRMRDTKTWIDGLSADLLGKMVAKGGGEFVSEYCSPLPYTVITTMMGLDPAMWGTMREWAESFTEQFKGQITREREIECAHLYVEYHEFLERLVNERRASSSPPDDLITGIAVARQEDGSYLGMADTISVLEQFVTAGAETTISTLSMGGLTLARRPDLLAALRRDETAVDAFVEETLRLFAPAQGLFRVATKDTELAGAKIPRGAKVMLRWGAANTDEAVFERAQEIDLDRPNARQHVTFGYGIHKCIGAPLARIELAATFRNLAAQVERLSLSDEAAAEHVQGVIFMGMKSVPMTMIPRAA